MKLMSLIVGAFLAIAFTEANLRDIPENDYQTGQKILYSNNGPLNFNDKNWYNQGFNQNYNNDYRLNRELYTHNGQERMKLKKLQRNYDQHSGFTSDVSYGSISSELHSQGEYIQLPEKNQNDTAYIIGNTCAKKMMKFYTIVEKNFNNNGQIQSRWSNEPLQIQQITVPLPNHQFLIMNENKINGLNQGTFKSIKLNTEYNNVEVDYHFNDLLVNGNLKTNNGQKDGFKVKMLNTDVTVTTELYNKNLKTVDTFNEKLEMSLENSSMLEKEQILNENTETLYMRYLKRTIENEMIENTFNGMIESMRLEAQREMSFPTGPSRSLEILNMKTGLKIALVNMQNWREFDSHNVKKISSVIVRPMKSRNGFRIKVDIVIAKQPSWICDINAQKGEQQNTFRNVQFQANEIVATATMESVYQHMGGRQFIVAEVDYKLNGLRFDLPNEQTLTSEVEHNLRYMIENRMSVALKEQLKQEYQTCQQYPEQCNQFNRSTQLTFNPVGVL